MTTSLSSSTRTMNDIIAQKDAEIASLNETINSLREDLAERIVEEEQAILAARAEEDEKTMRETDQEYDDECKHTDRIVDLALTIGEYEYALSKISKKLEKLAGEGSRNRRKTFAGSFVSLKQCVPEENIHKFFRAVQEFMDYQFKLHTTEKMINEN